MAGTVTSQAVTISPTTFRLTPPPDRRPDPVTEEAAPCVVDTGMPSPGRAEDGADRLDVRGQAGVACNLVIFRPIVSMIFQPPRRCRARSPRTRRSGTRGDRDRAARPDLGVTGPDEKRGDEPHPLLRVVCAMPEGDRRGREQLRHLERPGVVMPPGQPLPHPHEEHRKIGDRERHQRGRDDRDRGLRHGLPVDGGQPGGGQSRADQTADDGVTRRRRQPIHDAPVAGPGRLVSDRFRRNGDRGCSVNLSGSAGGRTVPKVPPARPAGCERRMPPGRHLQPAGRPFPATGGPRNQ